MQHENYMRMALEEAKKAYEIGEVPIGAVLVRNDEVLAQAFNLRHTTKNPLAHAELLVIEEGAQKIGDWRLEDCTLYVTLEPCPMCAGAIVQSRIPKVVIGAMDPKAGAAGSVMNILRNPDLNHVVEVEYNVLQMLCSDILKQFFKELRYRKKQQKCE